jgi:hypothetical protein
MTFVDRVLQQIEERGAEIISIRQNRHNVIQFKTAFGDRGKISASTTPSDRNAIHAVARDIDREIDRLSTRAVEPQEPQIESVATIEPERTRQPPHPARSTDRRPIVPIAGGAPIHGRRQKGKAHRHEQSDAHILLFRRMCQAENFAMRNFTFEKLDEALLDLCRRGKLNRTSLISSEILFDHITRKLIPRVSWANPKRREDRYLCEVFDAVAREWLEATEVADKVPDFLMESD